MFFGFLKHHKKAKTTVAPDPQPQHIVSLPHSRPYRIAGNILLLALIASVAVIIVTIRDNLINKKIDAVMEEFYAFSARYGWGIDDILIQGRDKSTREELAERLNLKRGDNILQVDLAQVKAELEELPWIKSAAVRRSFFPNVLMISIVEKDIVALWQSDEHFYPVDQKGKVIEADFVPHHPMLIIVGSKAPEKINELLEVISLSPEVMTRLKAAKIYAGRRWDIILDDVEHGLTIKMPEKNMAQVWQKFMKTDRQHGLLKRKLTFIDLRYKNKLIVTVDGSVYTETKTIKHQ